MKGRIIKKDICSHSSWTVDDIRDGKVYIAKNINQYDEEPWEGICPPGEYTLLAEYAGMDVRKVANQGYVEIDEEGRIKSLDI